MQRPLSTNSPHRPGRAGKETAREGGGSNVRFILMLALIAWAFRSLVAAPFNIPSGSMLPTLYIGDYLVVSKWPYGISRYSFPLQFPPISGRIMKRVPERGDVVVFRHPGENNDLIKRVIGLPGDSIEVRGGMVLLNGRTIPRQALAPYDLPISANTPCRVVPPAAPFVANVGGRSYCVFPAFRETLPNGRSYTVLDQVDGPADNFPLTRIPADHVFLMGDNRDDSMDSRYAIAAGGVGMVPIENLIGRASFTFWSTDGSASYWKPWTWFEALRPERIGNRYSEGGK